MKINIFNETHYSAIDEKKITRLVKKILKKEHIKLDTLNIIITDNTYLKRLNKMFFRKNRPTNVISFKMDNVSEIYVSKNKVKSNEELFYYIVHGLLHIIGYEHKNRREEILMENRCFEYINDA